MSHFMLLTVGEDWESHIKQYEGVKFDWYQRGGRYKAYLDLNRIGFHNHYHASDYPLASACLHWYENARLVKGDLLLLDKELQVYNFSLAKWDEVMEVFNKHTEGNYVSRSQSKSYEEWASQPEVRYTQGFFGTQYSLDDCLLLDRETYAKMMSRISVTPYAILTKSGEWKSVKYTYNQTRLEKAEAVEKWYEIFYSHIILNLSETEGLRIMDCRVTGF